MIRPELKLTFICVIILILIVSWNAMAGKDKSEIIFSHKLHVVENEMECDACHEAVYESVRGTDNLFPEKASCGNCHDIESTDECGVCHSNLDNLRNFPRIKDYYPEFSHKLHWEGGLECDACHAGIAHKEYAEPYDLPIIESCQECHTEQNVIPATHLANYQHTHGDEVRSTAVDATQTCNTCHSLQYCQTCHEYDNLDRFTHPLNYSVTHHLDARGRERDCNVCHIDRGFCIDCHNAFLVLPHNHTAGWANRVPGDGGRHSIEARRDFEGCLSCHEQNYELSCAKCHSK
jgi:c(7)-type cytochrome triheme protein